MRGRARDQMQMFPRLSFEPDPGTISKARALQLAKVRETPFRQDIQTLAKLRHWLWYHTYDSRRSTPGFPDLVLIKAPRMLLIECKTETGTVTTDQHEWLDQASRCTQISAEVWRPRHWDHIDATLT